MGFNCAHLEPRWADAQPVVGHRDAASKALAALRFGRRRVGGDGRHRSRRRKFRVRRKFTQVVARKSAEHK